MFLSIALFKNFTHRNYIINHTLEDLGYTIDFHRVHLYPPNFSVAILEVYFQSIYI